MKKEIFLILAISLIAATKTVSLLDQLVSKFEKIKSIKGSFSQTVVFPDGKEKVFQGVFYVVKGRSRWEYYSPTKQVVITVGDKIYIYDPAEKILQEGKMDIPFFLSGNIKADVSKIKKNFLLKEEGSGLILYPKNESNVSEVTIVFDSKLNIKRIITDYKTGEKSTLILSNIEYNANIPKKLFTIKGQQ